MKKNFSFLISSYFNVKNTKKEVKKIKIHWALKRWILLLFYFAVDLKCTRKWTLSPSSFLHILLHMWNLTFWTWRSSFWVPCALCQLFLRLFCDCCWKETLLLCVLVGVFGGFGVLTGLTALASIGEFSSIVITSKALYGVEKSFNFFPYFFTDANGKF